jgi:hypothetical protein
MGGIQPTNKILCLSQNTVHMIFLIDIICLAADFYEQNIRNLVPRYGKCLRVSGAYVAK